MKKRTEEKNGMTMMTQQTDALNKIIPLISAADHGYRTWCYTLETHDNTLFGDLIVIIRATVTDKIYARIQYVNGDMFKLECSGVAMLLTGEELIQHLKKLGLLR